jgi:hypothetical protein
MDILLFLSNEPLIICLYTYFVFMIFYTTVTQVEEIYAKDSTRTKIFTLPKLSNQ